MTPEELATYGRRLYGARSWRNKMAKNLGVTRATMSYWARGLRRISPPAERLIKAQYAQLKADRAREAALK
jgi:hypothetical protein